VVTTSIYEYSRFMGGPPMEDHTMALKLFRRGRHQTKTYPETEELLKFARQICNVHNAGDIFGRIAQGMDEALKAAASDKRVPKALLKKMTAKWKLGFAYATEARNK